MLSGKYITGMITLLINIFLIPVDELIKVALVICVVIISIIFNLFFFWKKLQQVMLQSIYEDVMMKLYKNDDFIQFLADRQRKSRKSHEE